MLLQQYKGREAVLLSAVRKKYEGNTEPTETAPHADADAGRNERLPINPDVLAKYNVDLARGLLEVLAAASALDLS